MHAPTLDHTKVANIHELRGQALLSWKEENKSSWRRLFLLDLRTFRCDMHVHLAGIIHAGAEVEPEGRMYLFDIELQLSMALLHAALPYHVNQSIIAHRLRRAVLLGDFDALEKGVDCIPDFSCGAVGHALFRLISYCCLLFTVYHMSRMFFESIN